MKSAPSTRSVHGMSLIELLCVIAIIAVLAALLLPALSQAKARALRVQCGQQLHEIGVGFIGFANDHGGKFPMAVPVAAGGSLEFATNGYRLQGGFYFSFRHFQVLSRELMTPKLLVCPTDRRPAAASFAVLSNNNLSYFVGVNSEFSRPTSILAGDRNLTNDYATPGTMVQLGPSSVLRWTGEMHQYKGDLLFADSHIEEKTSAGLVALAAQSSPVADLVLPSIRDSGSDTGAPSVPGITVPGPPANSAGSASSSTRVGAKGGSGNASPEPNVPAGLSKSVQSASAQLPVGSPNGSEVTPPPPKPKTPATNDVTPTSPSAPRPEPGEAAASPLSKWVAAMMGGIMRNVLWWLYLLLLLIVVAALVARRLARGKREDTK